MSDENDKTPEGDVGCIDGDLALDAQDFDGDVVKKTLRLQEKVSGDTASVTVMSTETRYAHLVRATNSPQYRSFQTMHAVQTGGGYFRRPRHHGCPPEVEPAQSRQRQGDRSHP